MARGSGRGDTEAQGAGREELTTNVTTADFDRVARLMDQEGIPPWLVLLAVAHTTRQNGVDYEVSVRELQVLWSMGWNFDVPKA